MSKRVLMILVVAVMVGRVNTAVLATPDAWYPFNGNANDESGNGYHGDVNEGTANEPTLCADRFGTADSAYSFDGDDYIEVPDGEALDPVNTQELSIASWINLDTHQAQNWCIAFGIVGKASSPNRDVGSYLFGVVNDNVPEHEGHLRFSVCYDGLHWQDVYSDSVIPTGVWLHVVVTHDSDDKTKFYIDGILDSVDDTTITTDFENTSYPLKIGHTGSYYDYFPGAIDDVYIFDSALSLNEIQQIIPEPVTLSLLVIGGLAVLRKRRKVLG